MRDPLTGPVGCARRFGGSCWPGRRRRLLNGLLDDPLDHLPDNLGACVGRGAERALSLTQGPGALPARRATEATASPCTRVEEHRAAGLALAGDQLLAGPIALKTHPRIVALLASERNLLTASARGAA